jgi:hypothetical protein
LERSGLTLPTSTQQKANGLPGLKRNNTQTRLSAANKPTPIDTTKPVVAPVPIAPILPTYNTELYCSAACAKTDEVRNSQQICQLEKEMRNLQWGQSDLLPSPLWMGGPESSASEGEYAQNATADIKVASPTVLKARSDDYDFGYFDMALHGVDRGLLERERRKSIQSQKNTPSILSGMIMKRNSSNYGYGYGYNQTVSSSDSLSSMWSSSDGKTFSEDSNASLYGGYGLHGRPFRGMTPLKPPSGTLSPAGSGSGPLSPNSRRPSMASARSLSFTKQAATSAQSTAMARQPSQPTSSSRPAVNFPTAEFGSAPASSLFHSYAASFHRTPSSTDLSRSSYRIRSSDAGRPKSRRPSYAEEDALHQAMKTERRASSSTDTMRGRHSFTPISTLQLGVPVGSAGKNGTDEGSTPTQSLVCSRGLALKQDQPVIDSQSMIRSISRESRSSDMSKTELNFPIFEEDEAEPVKSRTRTKSTASTRSSHSSKGGFLPRNSSFVYQDSPSTAITVGEQIIPHQSSSPAKPRFFKLSGSPRVNSDRQLAHSYKDSAPIASKASANANGANRPTPTTSSYEGEDNLSRNHRSFSWADLERQGKVTTYPLPPAIRSDDNQRLFHFG